jgi:ABC-type nitrate/sulfonate/bicarbonate transport system substrate-binding protein
MNIEDVTLVNLQPPQYVHAFTNGSVDALVAGNMFIDPIQKQSGSDIALLHVQNSQKGYWLLTCRDGWASSHPEQIDKLLKAIVQAEEYTINHPAEAKEIVQKKMNYTDAYMAVIWPQHQFSLTLDRSLLMAMGDEGRWMIKNNLTAEKTLPYFRDYIYTEGLEEVKPEAVNIR